MLYIATVHHKSPRWIETQARYLAQHVSVPYETWSSVDRIDPSYGVHFDRIVQQRGSPPAKLNHLALEISLQAGDEDLLMFLHGDAFPIADPMPLIADGLARAPLIAVRRAEDAGEPQPHPCFCVTTVGTWNRLWGDWSSGPPWTDARGERVSDVGANLLRRLELTETPWVQLLRSNSKSLDPLYFAIYGEAIYHHGTPLDTSQLSSAQRSHSEQVFENIRRGGEGWLPELI
ncbi:MAG: hypothetical protein M3Z95_08415 [Actinomycetota bacterium]|nr:hypothetical protein [Actinomycetota bacterium]